MRQKDWHSLEESAILEEERAKVQPSLSDFTQATKLQNPGTVLSNVNILCPKCQSLMVIMDRQGVHIDYCTQCHGVYLDRGELDKLIQLSLQQQIAAPAPAPAPAPARAPSQEDQDQYRRDQYRREKYDDDDDDYRYKKRKKGGFLSDIFDFD